MNRQTKRMMQRQTATGQDRLEAMRQRRSVSAAERRNRTPPRQFIKEVSLELKKVNWPTRQEMIAYTVVVLVAVVFLTSLVFGMDLGFSKAVIKIFGPGG
jgi:preprotein translocase subunit SecE